MDDLISKQKLIENLRERKRILEIAWVAMNKGATLIMAEHDIAEVPQEKIFEGIARTSEMATQIYFIDKVIALIDSISVASLA